MNATVYLNGRFVDKAQATVSVSDSGWLHGAGLFETMRAENGRVFRFEAHLQRLRRSASTLVGGLQLAELPSENVVTELMDRNGLRDARVRLTVSAGSVDASDTTQSTEPTVCLTASDLSGYPATHYADGVRVAVCDFRLSPSDPLAGHKTISYFPRLLALRAAHQARCAEALWFTTAIRLAEGSISNVFVVRDGALKTPPLDTPVLPGIARAVVLGIAGRLGIESQECPLVIDDLLDADEVVLTSAIMQVMPVIGVERHDIGEGRVGPIARKLLTEYRQCLENECLRS